ncbi:TPA: ATP-binding protein, partial [Klebsiella pneumoniae]
MKNLPVALKSVLPVALLGVLSVLIILHSMLSLRSLDQDYRALVERDARASLLINAALLDLADASRLALAVLSLQEEARMRASHGQLDRLQQRLQQRLLFVQAATIVDAAARWRGDRALRIIDEQFDAAEQAAEVKANFLATMSHEIRTPLNAIIGLTRLSLREPLPDSLQQRLDKVLHAGQHLLGILNDILDFSKAEGGHLQAEQIPFRPQQLLDDCQTLLGERAEEHGLQLHCEPVQIPGLLLGDPLRISQILTNYVSNAIKFSDRGQVQLRLALEHGPQGELYLRGEVQDQGIGLTEEQIGTLFQPFQQADSSITRRFGGTGLGLAICHNLAKLLGGSVGVQSAPWHGSTFWFRVRVREA